MIDYQPFFGPDIFAATTDATLNFGSDFLKDAEINWLNQQSISSQDQLVFPRQVHGVQVWAVSSVDISQRNIMEADAIVTKEPDLAIAVRTADCLPLFVYSPAQKVIAVIHAGWRSTQQRIVSKTLQFMKEAYGVKGENMKVALGPCLRPSSYEVDVGFYENFPNDVVERDGMWFFDLVAPNYRQLMEQDILKENIFDCGRDTLSDLACHSYRRDGDASGRLLNVMVLK